MLAVRRKQTQALEARYGKIKKTLSSTDTVLFHEIFANRESELKSYHLHRIEHARYTASLFANALDVKALYRANISAV